MPLYLLGISRSGDVPRLPGSVRWITAGDLAAAVLGPQPSPPEPAEHARTLAAIHRHISVLPMRFGAAAADEAAVRALLEKRRGRLASTLDRLEGTCEMGLRIWLPHRPAPQAEPVATAISPFEYLALRRAQYAWADELGCQAESAVSRYVALAGDLCRDWCRLICQSPGLVRLALLVDHQQVDALRKRLETAPKPRQVERCVLLGPWPPYSFV
jgi:hypothetical protein